MIGASLAANGEKEDLWVIAGGGILTRVRIAIEDLYGNEHDSIPPLILLSEIDPLDDETCIIEHLFIRLGRRSFSFPHPASLIRFYLPFILFGSNLFFGCYANREIFMLYLFISHCTRSFDPDLHRELLIPLCPSVSHAPH